MVQVRESDTEMTIEEDNRQECDQSEQILPRD